MEVMVTVISGVSVWNNLKRPGGFQEGHGGRQVLTALGSGYLNCCYKDRLLPSRSRSERIKSARVHLIDNSLGMCSNNTRYARNELTRGAPSRPHGNKKLVIMRKIHYRLRPADKSFHAFGHLDKIERLWLTTLHYILNQISLRFIQFGNIINHLYLLFFTQKLLDSLILFAFEKGYIQQNICIFACNFIDIESILCN